MECFLHELSSTCDNPKGQKQPQRPSSLPRACGNQLSPLCEGSRDSALPGPEAPRKTRKDSSSGFSTKISQLQKGFFGGFWEKEEEGLRIKSHSRPWETAG